MALPKHQPPNTTPLSGPDAVYPRWSYPLPEKQIALDPKKFTKVDLTQMNTAFLDPRAKYYARRLEYIPTPTGNERFQQVMLPVKEVRKGSPYVEAVWGLIDMKPQGGGNPRLVAAVNMASGGGSGYPALPGSSMDEMWRQAKKNPAAREALTNHTINSFKINYTGSGTEGFSRTRPDKSHWDILFGGAREQAFSIGIHPTAFSENRSAFRIHGSGRAGDGDEGIRNTWGCWTGTGRGMKTFFDAQVAAIRAGSTGAFVPPGTKTFRQSADALYNDRRKITGVMNSTVPIYNPLVINERSPSYVAMRSQKEARDMVAGKESKPPVINDTPQPPFNWRRKKPEQAA